MGWSTLFKLYKSKSFFNVIKIIIAIAPFFGYLYSYGFEVSRYRIALIGALLLILSYGLLVFFAPDIIKRHAKSTDYVNDLILRKAVVNLTDEFSFIDKLSERDICKYNLVGYVPLSIGIGILSLEQAIERYGPAKFQRTDNENLVTIIIIWMLFISGIIAIYSYSIGYIVQMLFGLTL